MALFNCLVKKDNCGKIEDIILLQDDFSWSAFIFNPLLWFAFHRMWQEMLYFTLSLLAISTISQIIPFFGSSAFSLAFCFLVAMNSKTWLGDHLIKKNGYQLIGMFFGKNSNEATIRAISEIQNNPFNYTSSNFISPFAPQQNSGLSSTGIFSDNLLKNVNHQSATSNKTKN